jgi:hypothetical protein
MSVSDESDNEDVEEVYSSLNDEGPPTRSPQSMLGPLPVPPKALLTSKSCECATEEPVCAVEGGIKFNPCYNNNPDMTNDLCDVMLDAVWQAGHAAAVHAGRTKCRQCSHFSTKFQAEMGEIFNQKQQQPGRHGHRKVNVCQLLRVHS